MGYATGAATSISNLLSAIESFAVAEGWTVDGGKANRSDGAARGECVNIGKGDVRGAFFSALSADGGLNAGFEVPFGFGLGTYTYPSWSGGAGNMAQAAAGARTITNNLGTTGVVAHHLFGGPHHLHVVIEVASGLFKHVGIGRVDRFGAVTTGVYNFGVRWYNQAGVIDVPEDNRHALAFDHNSGHSRLGPATILRADSDAVSPRYFDANAFGSTNILACGWRTSGRSAGLLNLPLGLGVSTLTGRAVLLPFMMSVQRSGGLFSPVGLIPDVRAVRIDNMNPGALLTLGADQWRVFPVIRKNGAAGQENSGTFGYAYLQRP